MYVFFCCRVKWYNNEDKVWLMYCNVIWRNRSVAYSRIYWVYMTSFNNHLSSVSSELFYCDVKHLQECLISSNGWQLGMKCIENVESFGYLHSKPKIKIFGCLMLKIISSTTSKTESIVKWTLNIVIKNCDTCTCTQMYTNTFLHQYGLTVTGWGSNEDIMVSVICGKLCYSSGLIYMILIFRLYWAMWLIYIYLMLTGKNGYGVVSQIKLRLCTPVGSVLWLLLIQNEQSY